MLFKRRVLAVILASLLIGSALLGTAATSAAADESLIHTVKWGETLSWIAWRYGVTIQQIVDANGLTSSNVIYAGQKLTIPVPATDYVEHIVQAGETMYAIAAKYGVSAWDIARRNGLWNINLIYVGQKLIIPGSGGTQPPAPEPSLPDTKEASSSAAR